MIYYDLVHESKTGKLIDEPSAYPKFKAQPRQPPIVLQLHLLPYTPEIQGQMQILEDQGHKPQR